MLRTITTTVRIGDHVKFPIGRLGDDAVYRHRFEVVAFSPDGCAITRRLADGLERTVSLRWIDRYTVEPYRQADPMAETARRDGLERVRRARLRRLAWQPIDRLEQPSYYVSARQGEKFALLLGPFADHYSALAVVPNARRFAAPYDAWHDIGYGTVLYANGKRDGKFNAELDREMGR